MLTTSLQVSIKIPTKDLFLGLDEYVCTCYGDSVDKNIYYIAPEIPIFLSQKNRPQFMFYKYRSDSQQGGYAQFTVCLPQPKDLLDEQIKVRLYKGIHQQLEARSRLLVNYFTAKSAAQSDPTNKEKQEEKNRNFKLTGLSEQEEKKFSALYDPKKGDEQFLTLLMPEDVKKIELKQPTYSSAKATLILDDNDKFYRQIPTVLSPSGMGDNNTVFSLSLTGQGATLFEQVLKGTDQNSSVAVRFDFGLEASLPAAKVTVSYDSNKSQEVIKSIERHVWSADEKKIERQFIENEAVKVNVEFSATREQMGMTEEQYTKWKQSLKEWGEKQITQILSNDNGLDMSLDMLKDGEGFNRFKQKLSEAKSFTRVYEENTVVSFSIHPQAQLPSIRSLVGEKNINEYFKEYDLKDPFFQYLQPEFSVTAGLEKYHIENIVITVKYDDNNVSTLVFDKTNDKTRQHTEKWFIRADLGRTFSYSYTINFSGAYATPYHSDLIKVTDTLLQHINIDQCGIVYADISTQISPQGWEKFEQLLVTAQYSDSRHGVATKEEKYLINKDSSVKSFVYPIGVKKDEPIYYKTDYYTKDGNVIHYIPETSNLVGYAKTYGQQIEVSNPLLKQETYDIIFDPEDSTIKLVLFEMTVDYPAHEFKQTKKLQFSNKDNSTQTASLVFSLMPESESAKIKINYKITTLFNNGKRVEKTEKLAYGDTYIII
ncbi:hypothetical protein DET57_10517 [Klebsiella oxytoca]|uniref:Uncharacterized protein n=1 Tax=Klebsiella oxytoca TaxID=571 RepID=A0A318FSJ5_KLEOX|nr:hypothetical protein [Klebsiella oxytoca]PXW46347.1 hypothetical protein DET57_10517 [Klebsiella oxytoca]